MNVSKFVNIKQCNGIDRHVILFDRMHFVVFIIKRQEWHDLIFLYKEKQILRIALSYVYIINY